MSVLRWESAQDLRITSITPDRWGTPPCDPQAGQLRGTRAIVAGGAPAYGLKPATGCADMANEGSGPSSGDTPPRYGPGNSRRPGLPTGWTDW